MSSWSEGDHFFFHVIECSSAVACIVILKHQPNQRSVIIQVCACSLSDYHETNRVDASLLTNIDSPIIFKTLSRPFCILISPQEQHVSVNLSILNESKFNFALTISQELSNRKFVNSTKCENKILNLMFFKFLSFVLHAYSLRYGVFNMP